ncbi:glucose/ribitol dehydrogenase, partial [Tanacetum coccineum]
VNNAAEIGLVCVDEKKFKAGGENDEEVQVNDDNVVILRLVDEEPYELGEQCLNINYYGTKRVTEALVHLLQLSKSPRIVNVSSGFGDLSFFNNEKLQEELHDIDKLTQQRIDEIIQWFLRDFKDAKLRENGWPLTPSAYKVSKATLNAYTRLMARKYCVTDMTYHIGFRSAEEGAKGPVMVALLPDDGPSGVYFNDKREIVPFWSM